MGLLGRGRGPLGPDAPLADHVAAIGKGRDGAVAAYVRALAARTLWVVAAAPPDTSSADVALLASALPDGSGRGLLVFTDPAGVGARSPGAHPLGMAGRDALDLVVQSYDGAVVDPHGRWQALRAAWVRDALA